MKKLILISMVLGLMATSAYAVPTVHVDVMQCGSGGNIVVTPNNAEGIAYSWPRHVPNVLYGIDGTCFNDEHV